MTKIDTFASLSTVECYTTKLIATLILLIPYAFFRMWKTETLIMFLLDFLLIANLMYFRTYYTAIPLNSYGLSGNLADFTGSVFDSLRWYDILFPLSTLAAAVVHRRTKTAHQKRPAPVVAYSVVLVVITRNIATKHISVQAAPPSIPFSVAFAMIWQVSNKS